MSSNSLTEFLQKSETLGGDDKGRYDNIVVIGTKHNKDLLDKLSGPMVKVLVESKLTPKIIESLVKSEMEYLSGRTLWILTTSLYSICEMDYHPDCKSCSSRLQYLFTRSQLSRAEIAERVQDILFHTNKTCTSLQTEMGLTGTMLIVPPIPAIVVQEAAFIDHEELHKICAMHSTPCASDVVLFRLHIFYNILCDAWSSLAIEWLLPFAKQSLFRDFQTAYRGKNLVSIKTKDPYDFVEQGWLLIVNVLLQMALDGTLSKERELPSLLKLQDMQAGMLTRHHENPVNVEDDVSGNGNSERVKEFKHCVIVGSSSFFVHLKEMLKDLPVSFLEKSMDLDEDGVNIIKEEKGNYPENTVWLIIRGVSEVAELTDVSPRCEEAKCEDPLYVFVLKNDKDGHPDFKTLNITDMIEKVLSRVIEFSLTVSKHLHHSSGVFLAPIIPVSAYFGGVNTAFSHDKLHEIVDKDPSTPILAGSSKEWMGAVQELDKKWMKMILDNLEPESEEYLLLQKLMKAPSNVLMFTNAVGKHSRLLKMQTTWGENLKTIISSLLGQKKTKKGKDNLAAVLEDTTKNQVQKDLGCIAPKLLEWDDMADSSRKVTPKVSVGKLSSGPAQPSQLAGHKSNITPSGSYLESAYPPGYVMTAPQVIDPGLKKNIPQSYVAQAAALRQGVVTGFPTLQPPAGGSSKKSRGSNSKLGASTIKKDIFSSSTPSFLLHPKKGKEDVEMCKMIVKNMKSKMKENHVKQILEACGTVVNFDYQMNKGGGGGRVKLATLHVQYNNAKATKRAVRVLNFLKVFGANSYARVTGAKGESGPCRELHTEDRLIIPMIQDVIVQMQKDKASKTKVSIVAKKEHVTTVTTMAYAIPTTTPTEEDANKALPVPEVKEAPKKEAKPPLTKVDPSKPIIHVHVTNLSKYVPVEAIKEAMRALGSLSESEVKQGEFICEFQDTLCAIRAVVFMSNYRLPDMKLKVYAEEPLDFTDAPVKPTEESTEQTNLVFKRYNDEIVNKLRDDVTKDINYFTYKTQVCKAIKCKNQNQCQNYHKINDRRRSPLTTEYSYNGCTLALSGQCQERQYCSLAHSLVERKFHLMTFRADLCEGTVNSGVCKYKHGNCPYAHPETPEMFFHKHWENLFIEGLGEIFKYVNGVIKNMFKLCNTADLQVVVLTSTFEMVQLLTKTFQNVAKSCRQNIVAVSQYGSVASDGTIMISTPVGIMKLLSRKEQAYSLSKVQAVIIDDGLKVFTALMNASPQDESLNELLSRPDVNKVVIDDSLTEGRVGVAAFIMKAQFKKLPADRPRRKWEPLNPAALEKEAAPAAVINTKMDSTAGDKEESSSAVFKVPALPIIKPKPKDNALKGKDTNSEKTEKPFRKSRFDDPMPPASFSKNEEDQGKKNDALNLIMANYKDFQKGSFTTALPQKSSQITEVLKEKQSSYVDPSREKSKSWSFQEKRDLDCSVLKIDAKSVPYYSASMKSKSYASIPFNYDDSGGNSSSQASLKGAKSSSSAPASNLGRYPGMESTKSTDSRFSRRSPLRGSRTSPSSADNRRSPSSDSRRSPPSSRSLRRSPTRDYRRSRSPLPSSKDSHSKRRTSPYGRSKYDIKKNFIEAELEMKEEHAKETKLFFDVPEVHPEFENKHKIFSERYDKQYPGKLDSKHKEQRWQEFWKVIVTGMQEIAWREKVDILKKQLKMEPESKDSRSSNKRKSIDSRDENDSSRKSSRRENDYGSRSKPREKSGNVERKSPSRQNSDRSSPSRRDHSRRSGKSSSSERESSKKGTSHGSLDQDFSIANALNLIGEVCNHLGVLKPALEIVIDRINRSGVNSKDAVSILTENDNALLIEMSYKRLESIAKTAPRGPFRNKLIKVSEETKKLKEFAALKLQEMAIAATNNAISSIKNRNDDSTASSKEKNKDNQVKVAEEASNLVRGLDVNKIARATHERGTEAIIEFIKNAFAYEGIINPTPQDINEIYREVSRLHFQMSLKDAYMKSPANTSERHQMPEPFLDNSSLPSRDKSDETFILDSSLMGRPHMPALGPSSSSNSSSPSLSSHPSKSVKDNSNQVLASSSGVNTNDGSYFHTRSSVQSNPSFTQGNKESPFPGGYQGYHVSDSSGRDPSAFQQLNYLAQGQGSHGNQNPSDEYNELQRDPESCVQPWNQKETDKSTIDFMNQRLDYLLQDTRLQTSKLNKNPQNETEDGSGFSRSDHQFSNQSNEHRQMDERSSRGERHFPNPNNERDQMHERFGRNERQFYDQSNEFGHRGERFGRGERQFPDQDSEREHSPMDERFSMGSRQFPNQNMEFNQMDERFMRGNRQYSNQHYERGAMEEGRLNMGDMPYGPRQGYEEAHDFAMDSRHFGQDHYKRMQHFGGQQDSCQRDFRGDREYAYQNASQYDRNEPYQQYERNEPYQDNRPWKREEDEFDDERQSDLRNALRGNIGKNESEIDINSMRIRGGPTHLQNQMHRGSPDRDWGRPGPHMMHQRNSQQSYSEEEEGNDEPERTPSELNISEFLNRFR